MDKLKLIKIINMYLHLQVDFQLGKLNMSSCKTRTHEIWIEQVWDFTRHGIGVQA